MDTIHTRIKQRREELGMSMKELAEKVGVSAWQTVQQWEKEGGTAPKRSRLQAVADALQTTPEFLTYGSAVAQVAALGNEMLTSLSTLLTDLERGMVEDRERRRKLLSPQAVLIGAAFDKLTTKRQRDAILSQLQAFEVWEWGELEK
ncbi:helix-turn-helix transcriptional regulator [Massilia antarctica]|uniref:Helix-turn-helix transcriptional regulator n=1 Tax=Massilia antarctica TaxID=2765360 RepID=A0AA48WL79_9BURK|nr:helix-turn-helix transcriptional regulator [Massilia antarctica]QPI52900.1 helix-turn-helix transcriptional regulator [Massilia antarctica]